MSDLINRQYAIATAISGRTREIDGERWIRTSEVRESLKCCPSAQPERKEGRWVRKSNWMWTCSCCGKDNAYAYAADDACEPTVFQDFFCPNCGAKMGGNDNADK